MPSRPRPAALLLIVTVATVSHVACSTSASDQQGIAERDSAGSRIVEHSGGLGSPARQWIVSPEPLADIGTVDGDSSYQLYRVESAAILSDGRIVIANTGTSELRLYDERGTFIRSIGRDGEGPGEFRNVSNVWAGAGDTLLAWDFQLQRLSIFSADGEFLRSRSSRAQRRHFAAGVLDDGSLIVVEQIPSGGLVAGRTIDFEIHLLRDDPAGAELDTLGRYPHSLAFIFEIPGGSSRAARQVTFSAFTSIAALGDRVAVATGRGPEIRMHVRDAPGVTVLRWSEPPLPVTDADADAYKQQALERAPEESRARMRERFADEPFAEHFPATGRVLLEHGGRLWVEHWMHPHSEDPPMWTVFARDGRMLATVEMPPGFRLLAARDDVIVGLVRDDLDVEQVRSYRVQPGGTDESR